MTTLSGTDVLLVEDDANDVELALYAFKKHRLTNDIQVVRDGAEALEYLFASDRYKERDMRHLPKIVLLDLKLPLVDGLDVLRRIREDTRTRHLPVVMLTSSQQETDVVKSYALGVNSFIVKPVDFDQFTEAVREIGMYWLLLNQPPPKSDQASEDGST